MIRVPANVYLDHRRPEWIDAEMMGFVKFDGGRRVNVEATTGHAEVVLTGSRLVEIADARPDIQRACGGAV